MRIAAKACLAASVLSLMLTWATPVLANDGGAIQPPPTPDGHIVNNSPEVIVVTSPGGPSYAVRHRGAGRHGRWECHYFAVGGVPGSSDPAPLWSQGPVNPQPKDPVVLNCLDENGLLSYQKIFVFDPGNPLGDLDVPARAAEEARKLLLIPLPAVRLSPPAGASQLVGVPTWLWIADPWAPLQASATLAGVTATVTAVPVSVTWDLGDGATVACAGPGTAYDTTRSPADQHSDCTFTFQRRGPRTLTATVTYSTGWTATTGDGEPLDIITRATTVPIAVIEAQALIR